MANSKDNREPDQTTKHPSIDRHPSIISLATPTILLVPIQPISLTTFNQIVQLIKQFSTLPLSELSPSTTVTSTHSPPPSPTFNPSNQPQLLLNFNSTYFFSPSLSHHKFLHPFQPHRKPFGIIGIIDCSRWGPSHDHQRPRKDHINRLRTSESSTLPSSTPTGGALSDALRSFEILLATHHPRTPVGRCFGFHPTDSQRDDVEGLILIPHIGDQTFYLQRLIAELATDLYRAFQHLSTVLQSTSSLETPRQSHISTLFDSFPILPPLHLIPSSPLPRASPESTYPGNSQSFASKLAAPKARQPVAHMLSDMKILSRPSSPLGIRPNEPSQHLSPPTISNRLLSGENRMALSFSPPLIDTRTRKKHLGRIRKVEADLELLAAKPLSALRIYTEAINYLKVTNDLVWWAGALEGLAVARILSLLAGLELENGVQEILDPLESAVETYSKVLSKTFDGTVSHGNVEVVEPLVFVESTIRLLNFKLELAQLDDSESEKPTRDKLRTLLGNHLARPHKSTHSKPFPLEVRLDINRIGSMIELAIDGLQFAEDRTQALSKLISAFEAIGFMRKAAWFKRKLVAVVVEQITKFGGSVPSAGREELVKLMREVCDSFRISVDNTVCQPIVMNHSPGEIVRAQSGWKELQLGVLIDAVITCCQLKEPVDELKFRFMLNKLSCHQEPHGLEVKGDDRRINMLLKSLSHTLSLNYWGPKDIILAIELTQLANRHAPMTCYKRPQLQVGPQTAHSAIPVLVTPTFYYNHNRSPTVMGNDAKVLSLKMVKDEPIYVVVTLQNPLSFDLEISMICLSTSGMLFEAVKTQVVINAQTVQTVLLTGVPLAMGTLKIKGCHIQLIGCQQPQEFVLPVGKPKWKRKEEDEEEVLTCQVVDCLPLFRIVSGYEELIDSGGLMVYDGEMITIDVKILNTSKASADWLDVKVQDTLSDEMRKKLDEPSHQQTELERYQIEYELVNRPVLSVTWSSTIEGHGMGWVKIKCLGKAGCRSVSISIDYGVDSLNLKRHLDWTVGLSVQKCLNVVGFETLPGGIVVVKLQNSARGGQVFEVEAKGGKDTSKPFFRNSLKQVLQPGGTHSFFIEVEPIKITQTESERLIPTLIDRQFVINHDQERDHSVNQGSDQTNSSHQNSPQKRILMDRLRFWIKDKLLKTIKMDWRELGTNKSGEVNMRGIDITSQMIANLRSNEVSVQMEVLENFSKEVYQSSKTILALNIDEFYSIRLKTRNFSGTKRKVKIFTKVMGLDGNTISAVEMENDQEKGEEKEWSYANYLIEGMIKDSEGQNFDERYGFEVMRMIMLEGDDDKEEEINFKLCFLTHGSFLLQTFLFHIPNSSPYLHSHHHDQNPNHELVFLGSSDLVQLQVS